jgi:hypothetical protein
MTDPLDEIVRALRESGVDARRRDWALGRTVVVPGGTCHEHEGLVVWERVVWVVAGEAFSVVHPDLGTLARELSASDATRVARLAVGEGGPVLAAAARHVRVVEALAIRGQGYVIVDVLAPERAPLVAVGATLDGCPLEPWIDQPRALDSNGLQLAGRFALALHQAPDLAHFAPGQVRVFLPGTARSAPGLARPGATASTAAG